MAVVQRNLPPFRSVIQLAGIAYGDRFAQWVPWLSVLYPFAGEVWILICLTHEFLNTSALQHGVAGVLDGLDVLSHRIIMSFLPA